jgi:hypothetical protein
VDVQLARVRLRPIVCFFLVGAQGLALGSDFFNPLNDAGGDSGLFVRYRQSLTMVYRWPAVSGAPELPKLTIFFTATTLSGDTVCGFFFETVMWRDFPFRLLVGILCFPKRKIPPLASGGARSVGEIGSTSHIGGERSVGDLGTVSHIGGERSVGEIGNTSHMGGERSVGQIGNTSHMGGERSVGDLGTVSHMGGERSLGGLGIVPRIGGERSG